MREVERPVRHAVCALALLLGSAALAEDPPPDIGKLVEQLHASETNTRREAALQLGAAGPAAKEAVPALMANLGHNDAALRGEVADALAMIGAEAKPKLIEALAWKEPLQRSTAALALGQFGKAAGDAAPALLERLTNET